MPGSTSNDGWSDRYPGQRVARRQTAGRFEFSAISDYLAEDDTLVWGDIYDPDHDASGPGRTSWA